MRQLILCLTMALPLFSMALPKKAAIVYGPWGNNAFKNEFDGHIAKYGWDFDVDKDKYKTEQLPQISDKLNEYGLIVATSLANYVGTIDMKPYAQKWVDWIKAGGIFIVVDANYHSVNELWVNRFGPTFAVATENCSRHTKGATPETTKVTLGTHPILYTPQALGDVFIKRYQQWGHIKTTEPSWQRLITCCDGYPLMALQEVGEGIILMTSASSLKNNPIGGALIENLTTYQLAKSKGIKLLAFQRDLPLEEPITLPNGVKLTVDGYCLVRGGKASIAQIQVVPAKIDEVTATLTSSNADGWKTSQKKTVKADAEGKLVFDFQYALIFRGNVKHSLSFAHGKTELMTLNWEQDIAPAFSVKFLRKHLYPGDELLARFNLNLEKLGSDKLEGFEASIDDGPWKPVTVTGENEGCVFDVSALKLGDHRVAMRLKYRDGFLDSLDGDDKARDWGTECKAEFHMHPEPKYRMRKDLVLLENGKPFFPLGFYDVSWSFSTEERLAMVRDIAKYGYNAVHVGILGSERNNDSYGKFLDECAKLNIRVITEFGCPPEEVIPKYKDKPAVMGWNPGDEPAAAGISPETMFGRYDSFKKMDYNHLAYTVICIPAQYGNYSSGTDVLAPDPYPVPGPFASVFKTFSRAKQEANKYNTALWAVCQAFGGQKYGDRGGWKRWPNPQEFRAMSYLSMFAGAKGIIYYTYKDGSFDIRQAPDLYEAAKTFPAELEQVTPFVLDGQFKLLADNVDGIYVGQWTIGNEQRTVVISSNKDTAEITVETKADTVLFGKPVGLKAKDGKLTISILPGERVVLK